MAVLARCSLLLFVLSVLFTPGCGFLLDWDHSASSAPLEPHFTDCLSRDQVTFRCWWSLGSFQNLSSPDALRVFYLKKDPKDSEWKECPHYIYSNRECFFDANHTAIWVTYCLQLRSHNVTYFNEDDCFTVENIVRPDSPVALNWTLLNISPSGLRYDVMVSWEPPLSAEVELGWMRLQYELRYREQNATKWQALEMQAQTQQTIYGLLIGREYEVHIRCRMLAFTKFGDFSKSIFIQVTEGDSRESTFPFMLAFIFGILGIFVIIISIVLSQQHRLLMILLPPIPAPKIKGIDPELLKKGKLEELNFMLSGGGMGGLPIHAPDFYQDEPWVEFIEVDTEEVETGEKEDNQGSDTQRLLGLPQPVSHHMHICCSNALSFPDDDSGRASCYDSDQPDQDPLIPMATLLPGQPEDRDPSVDRGLIHSQTGAPQTWVNTDFYAQVSNVMPSGGVVLSPGQQLRIQENREEVTHKKGSKGENSSNENAEKQDLQIQLLVVVPESAENNVRQMSTPPTSPMPSEVYHTVPLQTVDPKPVEEQQSPYILPDSTQSPLFAPVADYTVVQEVDSRHSLLLNPPPHQSPPPCLPQHPLKSLPAMPLGYVIPDLLGNLSL